MRESPFLLTLAFINCNIIQIGDIKVDGNPTRVPFCHETIKMGPLRCLKSSITQQGNESVIAVREIQSATFSVSL